MKSFNLKGQAAMVTGSSRGIGAAIADGLEEAGASVLRHGREKPDDAEDANFLAADLLQTEAVSKLIADAFSLRPELSILICNAGGYFDVPFLQMDRERFAKTMRLNVEQAYFLIQGFARELARLKRPGTVVIIGSTNGLQAEQDSTAYDSSKGALIMMTRSIALALAPQGIRVNAVAPGLIRTPLTSGWMDASPELVRHYEKKILAGRIGAGEDCAGAAVFLCSDAASYVIGQTIVVDGGLTVGQIGSL